MRPLSLLDVLIVAAVVVLLAVVGSGDFATLGGRSITPAATAPPTSH